MKSIDLNCDKCPVYRYSRCWYKNGEIINGGKIMCYEGFCFRMQRAVDICSDLWNKGEEDKAKATFDKASLLEYELNKRFTEHKIVEEKYKEVLSKSEMFRGGD